mmetsp:Transcript_9841/g.28562  ORF Transcript_9841/g.28562 Transcript_9841/m.28562 type:complete len:209 (-) Transcript_9841:242-868(-)
MKSPYSRTRVETSRCSPPKACWRLALQRMSTSSTMMTQFTVVSSQLSEVQTLLRSKAAKIEPRSGTPQTRWTNLVILLLVPLPDPTTLASSSPTSAACSGAHGSMLVARSSSRPTPKPLFDVMTSTESITTSMFLCSTTRSTAHVPSCSMALSCLCKPACSAESLTSISLHSRQWASLRSRCARRSPTSSAGTSGASTMCSKRTLLTS